MYAHLYILLCFGSFRDPPTPSCTKVYFILLCFGRKFDHPPPKWYFCTEKLTKSAIFSKIPQKNSKKFKKIWSIFQKFLGNFQEFFNKNWENFRLFFPKFDLFLQFFGIFYENFVQKYQLYFCDFGKNVDTHPWLYKSTLYTFVFWVPSGPTPPHTRRVLLYLPPGPLESGIAIIIGQGAGNERSECA